MDTRSWVGAVACLAPLVFVLLMTVVAGDTPSTAASLAATACTNVLEAGRDTAAGKRLPSSYLLVTRASEADARTAAAANRRYRPILEAVVVIRSALEAGRFDRTAPGAAFLSTQCG